MALTIDLRNVNGAQVGGGFSSVAGSDPVFTTAAAAADLASVTTAYTLDKVKTAITDITAAGAAHSWKVELGDGVVNYTATDAGDNIVLNAAEAAGTIKLGDGKDTVDASATFTAANKVSLSGYNYDSDVIVLAAGAGKVFQDSVSSAGLMEAGTANQISLQLNATDGIYKAHLNVGGDDYYVWKGATAAQEMDGSSDSHSLFMIAGDSSDTLIGGSKADSIFATTEGAYAFGGAGSDSIILGDGTAADTKRQLVAISTDSGKDTVEFFTGGFGESADVLVLRDGVVDDITFSGVATADLAAKLDGGKVTLEGFGVANRQILVQDKNGDVSKVAVAKSTAAYTVAKADDLANYYIGEDKSQVIFTGIDDDLAVDLGNTGNFEDNATFKNIVSVTGGTGKSSLAGASDTANLLVSGGGETTLWGGGASNDTLQGGAKADAFFVGRGDGMDTVVGFNLGVDTDKNVDTLYLLNSPVDVLKNNGTNTTLTLGDGSAVVLQNKAAGAAATEADAIRFTLDGQTFQTAIVGNSTTATTFTYSSDVNMFFGGNKKDTVKIASTYDASSVDIRLNNTGAQSYASVEVVDASAFDGKTLLAGNDGASESLIGGKGKTTLWGGIGGEDTLTGTSGDVTSFYFGANNGADVITASDSDDKVIFYDLATTDLASVDTSGSKLVFNFNDGSSLSLNGYTSSSVNTFQFTDGTYTYDKATKTATLKG